MAGQQLPPSGGWVAAARALASSAPLGFSGLALRRQDAPLPMRLSECETRGGGAEQEQEEGEAAAAAGRGRREGRRRLRGSEPRTYWWARSRSRAFFGPPSAPLALGGSGAPRTRSCRSRCHWGRVRGPRLP